MQKLNPAKQQSPSPPQTIPVVETQSAARASVEATTVKLSAVRAANKNKLTFFRTSSPPFYTVLIYR